MNKKTRLLGAISIVAALATTPAFADVVNVTPGDLNGWAFSNQDNAPHTNASGGLVNGPGTPPIGTGSAQLLVNDASSSEILAHTLGTDFSLNSISTLSYDTYVTTSTPGSGAAPSLDFDLFSSTGAYEGRLVFDPGLLGTVQDGTWQDWNTLSDDAWYFTSSALKGDCGIASASDYCTFSEALGFISGSTAGDVLFKAGSGQASFNGNVDDFVLNGTTTNFDVPEPFTMSLFGVGLVGAGVMRRRRKAKA
jgi:hypothetical protein